MDANRVAAIRPMSGRDCFGLSPGRGNADPRRSIWAREARERVGGGFFQKKPRPPLTPKAI
jgi:hypothetical protein